MNSQPMRILWQSSRPLHQFPAYVKALETHVAKLASPGTVVTMRGVKFTPQHLDYKYYDFLNNMQLFESVVEAEREGYDAVAVGCVIDPILDELREAVNIPIVAWSESAMHVACMLGRRFSIMTHNSHIQTKYVEGLVERYHMQASAAPMVNFDLSFEDLEQAMAGNPQRCFELTTEAAERAVAGGAEVIILGCGLLNLIAMHNGWHKLAGATVLDASGCLLKMTEMMVALKRVSNVEVSRVGYYARPPADEAAETYKRYGLFQQPAQRVDEPQVPPLRIARG